MASPCAPLSPNASNNRTPGTAQRATSFEKSVPLPPSPSPGDEDMGNETIWNDAPSSPFISIVDQENVSGLKTDSFMSPTRTPSSRSRTPSSRTASSTSEEQEAPQTSKKESKTPLTEKKFAQPTTRTPAWGRSPTKFSRSPAKSSPTKRVIYEDETTQLRDNEGLTIAMREMEAEAKKTVQDEMDDLEMTSLTLGDDGDIDNTCFSTFSEVPDMTQFSKLGQRSPQKGVMENTRTPRSTAAFTPSTARRFAVDSPARSPSPTSRRQRSPIKVDGDTTNLLIDFTQQIEAFSTSSHRTSTRRGSPSKTESNLLSYINNQRSPAKGSMGPPSTPGGKKNILNLLDFELPPAPTPRSIPTITVRELESLKSSYLSEISSLKATLSGREAEVGSLKKAVNDAERRVGEALETVREERSKREHVEKEKAEWEKRGIEVEKVLRSVREEIMTAEKEREELMAKLRESEQKAEEAETRAHDAEAQAAEAKSKVVEPSCIDLSEKSAGETKGMYTAEQVQQQIDEKIHTLSTELHAIYKKKHVTKVAGLKKGFEAKAKERTAELQHQVDELTRQNEELQTARDATLSGPLNMANLSAAAEEQRSADLKRLEAQKSEIEGQKAKLAGLCEEVRSVRLEHTALLKELEKERVEKGELLEAVDEMLLLQSEQSIIGAQNAVEDLKKSVSRPVSGLRAPAAGSRIGAPSGLNRAGSGRSKLLSNIERMGGRTVE